VSDDESEPETVLSLTRLLSRVLVNQPSGVDRVELSYARELTRQLPGTLSFSAWNPLFKRYGRLSSYWANRYIDLIEERWTTGKRRPRLSRKIDAFWWMVALYPLPIPSKRPSARRVLIQPSPDTLDQPRLMARIVAREGGAFVALVHDLIPIEHPEYARPGGEAIHRRRMATLARLADGLVANSQATANGLARLISKAHAPEIRVAPLGTHGAFRQPPRFVPPAEPYFVCLGTIEPRKNHLLLLNIWRRLAEISDTPPRLLVIGKRGWENENIVDMLERCPAIAAHAEEINGMADVDVTAALSGARALLMPSFAEGFGMPVAEALMVGTPVICSDLPALREAGGSAPEYLDPLDGTAWIRIILDYAAEHSSRRDAALARICDWTPPTWHDHLQAVCALARKVAH
jgi:glycosyltransferase involved in cell wall biosynthesis